MSDPQVIALDVPERRRATLSAGEAALRATLEGAPIPIALMDLDLRPLL